MAPCHIHPQEQKVLGVLDMGMSLERLDRQVNSLVKDTVLLGLGTLAAVLGTIGLYLTFRVHKPVTQLRDAAMKLALGDYSHKLNIKKGEQVGECAWAFNMMRDQVRRRTQELARSREEYKRLFEQVPCFICVIDKKFEIVRQNSYMRELFRGAIGMHCYEAFKKRSTKCEECHADVTFEEGKTSGKEHCGLMVTGEEANYLSYVTPILDEKGQVLYAMIIAVDIGDRVRLQRALETSKDFQANLIENSIHGIIATDEHGRVNIYNRAAENLLGYSPQDVLGDSSLEKYFPHKFVEMVVASHLGKKIDSTRLVAQETVVTASDGEFVPVRFSGFILFSKEITAGAVGFLQDLRTYKELEREKQSSDRLAVVGQTVAGLAHGIKNILTGLDGGVFVVETAMEDRDDQLLHRGWKTVQNNINRISGLVKDLLSYSKERAPQYEETDPNLLAEEVCALFDVKAHNKSIVIERDFDPEAGRMFKIFLDQRGIHTCLSNLVANAMDACESDSEKRNTALSCGRGRSLRQT
jgi:PAS domain S-box-containing protein